MTRITINELIQRGMDHHHAGRHAEAQKAYEQVLAVQPNNVVALHMLGMLWGQGGRSGPALEILRRVVQLVPDRAEAHNNLGNVLRDSGMVDEAMIHFTRAVELDGTYPGAYRNMGNVYMDQGRHDQAEQCFAKALAINPNAAEIHSNWLYILHFRGDYDAKMLLVQHREWAKRQELPLISQRRPHDNDPNPDRPLKVGYVSGDFCNHPVGRFLLPVFVHHDRRQFEIYCYSQATKLADSTTRKLQMPGDQWKIVTGLSHQELAEQIRRDRIDILVDLSQHSGENRLVAFAYKPAPVQVAWLGYPGTTGLEAMDYRLTDPYLDPPGQGDEDYTERSIRLPNCFWCYQPLDSTTPVNPLPAAEDGYVTFGCLNRFNKVTGPTLELWRRILKAVPNSRMLIHSKIGDHLDGVRRDFQNDGIAPRRVEFVTYKPVHEYMRQFHRIDISLDPFPHGGGTVTCDSLWMGVPVVTLSGRTAVGRGGASLLNNVGLPELIATTPEQYIEIAVSLAGDLVKLSQMRKNLRPRMIASPMLDAKRFTADIETAYRQMWKTWCSTHQPAAH